MPFVRRFGNCGSEALWALSCDILNVLESLEGRKINKNKYHEFSDVILAGLRGFFRGRSVKIETICPLRLHSLLMLLLHYIGTMHPISLP